MNGGLWSAPELVPSIVYTDVPRAAEWLERVFGFRERRDARLSWPGGGMAWLEVGQSLFSISTPDLSWGQPQHAVTGFFMKVYVDDVDAHYERARSEGATILFEPQDGFWGGRIYRALDHEGHQWELSQSGRDLPAGQWQLPPGVTRGVQPEILPATGNPAKVRQRASQSASVTRSSQGVAPATIPRISPVPTSAVRQK